MFPTFSGNSRRARNVNLSGQKNTNPFAASSGTSKSVADAAAERRQRQLERDRKQAALKILRVWRGHRVRSSLCSAYRTRFDELYIRGSLQGVDEGVPEKLPEALSLLLYVFDASLPADLSRLAQVAEDVDTTLKKPWASSLCGSAWTTRMHKLTLALMKALDTDGESQQLDDRSDLYLEVLVNINSKFPQVLSRELPRYYTVIGHCLRRLGSDIQSVPIMKNLMTALVLPLDLGGALANTAYREFAVSFLTQPRNTHFEEEVPRIAQSIDMEALSAAVIRYYSNHPASAESQDERLWLFAHFIDLLRATNAHKDKSENTVKSNRSINLKALYIQLSALSGRISIASSTRTMTDSSDSKDASSWLALPQYVEEQLGSLVSQEGISDLLERFTLHHSAEIDVHSEDASLIAAYTLTLIYSFPSQSDGIRMRLYLVDIQTPDGPLPALRYFWDAMTHTRIFRDVMTSEDNALPLLRLTRSQQGSVTGDSLNLDREWRSILLFLELYSFVLRLTDDDDFFSGVANHMSHNTSSSRLRQNGLVLEQLLPLTRFLKHLSFTLIHDSAKLLDESSLTTQATRGETSRQLERAEGFSIIPGVDYTAFKSIVATTMRMLYERDSRRPFLPNGHWLMTSKFDMEDFLSAVVLEEQRQQELKEKEEREDEEGEDSANDDDVDEDDDEYRALSYAGLQRSRLGRMELVRRQRKKAFRDRALAQVGPKLEILRNMPFIIPFEVRVKIFRQLVTLDKVRRRNGYIDPDHWRAWIMQQSNDLMLDPNAGSPRSLARHHAKIKRGQIFEDAMKEFYQLGDGLKEPIQITFVDQFDTVEAGIDGGGVTKEFLMSVTKEAFTDQHRLFVTNNKNAFYPNPSALDQTTELLRKAGYTENSPEWKESISELMKQYEFLGRIIGKCMYEGILIDIVFAGFFLLKWATSGSDTAYRASINDLREMDDELYQGMLSLKTYSGDVSELGLDFTLNDQVSFPGEPVRTVTRNLIPNGEDTLVTNENRPLYISYVARHRLVVQPYAQTKAFLRGLGSIIDPKWLSMFNQNELQRLVGGDSSEIDVDDLRNHTEYSGVYEIGDDGEEHPTVQAFWEVMYGLEDHEKRDVLKYVTSTPRAPLLGFSQLRPAFTIRDGGQDQERLPSASTCVNLLKLPQYRSAATLKRKLLYAVQSGAGFDLS